MGEQRTKRKAGIFAKTLGTSVWGVVLLMTCYFMLPKEAFWLPESIAKDMGLFFTVGLCWPVVWLGIWLTKVILPMPLELAPRFVGLILLGPGHLLAWAVLGRDQPVED